MGGTGKKRLTFTTLVEWQDAPISVELVRWQWVYPTTMRATTCMVQVEIPTSIRWDLFGWGLVSPQSRAASGILECFAGAMAANISVTEAGQL